MHATTIDFVENSNGIHALSQHTAFALLRASKQTNNLLTIYDVCGIHFDSLAFSVLVHHFSQFVSATPCKTC